MGRLQGVLSCGSDRKAFFCDRGKRASHRQRKEDSRQCKLWDEDTAGALIQSRLDGTSVSFPEGEISRLVRERAGQDRRRVLLYYKTYAGHTEKLQ